MKFMFTAEITAGELLVGLGTLALAIATFWLVKEERNARKEASKPILHLTGGMYTYGSTIPHWLYLRCSSGVAKELNVEYKYEDVIIKKFCMSLPAGEMILLDPNFNEKYEKESKIDLNVTYKHNSEILNETLSLDLAKIKSGEIEISYVSPASPLKDVFEDIKRELRDIAGNIKRLTS